MPAEVNINETAENAVPERDRRIADQQAQIQQLTDAQKRIQFTNALASRGLPAEFAEVIDAARIDGELDALKRAEAFNKVFADAVENAVKQRFPEPDKAQKAAEKPSITKAEIMAIKDFTERQRAIMNNMELFTKPEPKESNLRIKYNIPDNPRLARLRIVQIQNSAERLALMQEYKHLFE